MTGKQLQIFLPPDAAGRLLELAQRECRRPNEQAKYLLLRALLGNGQQSTNSNSDADSAKSRVAVVELAR